MPQYTVKSVTPREQYTSQYGTFQVYALELQGYNGYVQLSQKADKAAPNPGEVLNGDITRDSRGNPKFKKEYSPAGGSAQGSGRSYGERSAYQPKDEAAIKAMWAIGQAIALTNPHAKASDPIARLESVAKELFDMVDRVKTDPMENVSSDGTAELPPVEVYDKVITTEEFDRGQINIDDIPF